MAEKRSNDRVEPEVTIQTANESLWATGLAIPLTLGLYYPIWRGKSLTLTNKRLTYREGVISRKEHSVRLGHILDVRIKQNLWGRMFHYGNIYVETAGSGKTELKMKHCRDPQGMKDAISEAQDALADRQQADSDAGRG